MTSEEIGPVVNLQDIFTAPVAAVIQADYMAAREFVKFLEQYGFTPHPDRPEDVLGDLRMITFSYQQPGPGGQPIKRFFSLPALSLIPLPLLEVKQASFEFHVRVLAALQPSDPARVSILPPPATAQPDPLALQWRAMLAQGTAREGDETTPDLAPHLQANLMVKLAVGQADIPAGIKNLLALMGENGRLSPALLNLTPPELLFRPNDVRHSVVLTVFYHAAPGTQPPEVQAFYRQDSALELRDSQGVLWKSGESRLPERGRIEFVVVRAGPYSDILSVPVLFHITVEQTDAITELRCLFTPLLT